MQLKRFAQVWLFSILVLSNVQLDAQIDKSMASEEQDVTITVGDTLVLGKSKGAQVFAFLDRFTKTRWDPRPLPLDSFTLKYQTYDSTTGNGFYRYFFRGDFDAAELENTYQGLKFEILGLEVLSREKDGSPMNVIYLKTDDPNTVIMVDVDPAFQYGEIESVILGQRNN